MISVSQLTGALKLGDLGQQVVLKSREAFKRIRYIGSEGVLSREWFPLKRKRDNLARREYFNMNRTGYVRGDLYMIRIIDEEVKPDQEAEDPSAGQLAIPYGPFIALAGVEYLFLASIVLPWMSGNTLSPWGWVGTF